LRIPFAGAIDCDVHVTVPGLAVLVPYLDTYWRERVRVQQLERLDLTLTSYPPTAPLSGRADWRPEKGPPGSDLALLQREALDKFQLRYAILNCLWGSQALFAEDMAAALCRAVNDWVASEWLDRDPRLRASIMVPAQNPELAAAEIEHRASDPRFVQVLVLAGLMPAALIAIRRARAVGRPSCLRTMSRTPNCSPHSSRASSRKGSLRNFQR
jgi:predicted TIM-barrel fold metal-dependent hydrolase